MHEGRIPVRVVLGQGKGGTGDRFGDAAGLGKALHEGGLNSVSKCPIIVGAKARDNEVIREPYWFRLLKIIHRRRGFNSAFSSQEKSKKLLSSLAEKRDLFFFLLKKTLFEKNTIFPERNCVIIFQLQQAI